MHDFSFWPTVLTILGVFGARWDETEVISLASCWRTVKAFLLGREYRYSPVSALFLFGRSQDFALQRVRESINERLHLRLWRATTAAVTITAGSSCRAAWTA